MPRALSSALCNWDNFIPGFILPNPTGNPSVCCSPQGRIAVQLSKKHPFPRVRRGQTQPCHCWAAPGLDLPSHPALALDLTSSSSSCPSCIPSLLQTPQISITLAAMSEFETVLKKMLGIMSIPLELCSVSAMAVQDTGGGTRAEGGNREGTGVFLSVQMQHWHVGTGRGHQSPSSGPSHQRHQGPQVSSLQTQWGRRGCRDVNVGTVVQNLRAPPWKYGTWRNPCWLQANDK